MITKTINLFQFDELNEEAKQKAIEVMADINVDYEWWESIYEDAKTIGLKITSFDLDRYRHCKGEFLFAANEVAQNILNNHGEMCDTYKIASTFMEKWQPVFNDYMDESNAKYESRESEIKLSELEDEFLNELLEEYSIILQKESEYLQSEEAIIDTIRANEYYFKENGIRENP